MAVDEYSGKQKKPRNITADEKTSGWKITPKNEIPKGLKEELEDVIKEIIGTEASTYRDRAKDDEKKKKRHFAFGGKKDKTRHGAGGYGKGEEVEEKKAATGYELYHKDFSSAMQHAYAHAKKKGFVVDPKEIDDKVATGPKKPSSGKTNRYALKAGRKTVHIQVANLDNKRYELNMYIEGLELIPEGFKDLPPHLQKSLKEFEKKQKALKKQFPELKTKTFVYNPDTGKPDIEVKEDYDKNQLLRVQHDERLIAEAGDICGLDRGDLRSKSMQKVWDKKCAPENHKKSIFGKVSKGLSLYNQNSIGEEKMEKLVDTVRKVLVGEGEGDMAVYQKKRKAVAKKFGVESCSALKDEKEKKACYKALDDAHVADHEEQVYLKNMNKAEEAFGVEKRADEPQSKKKKVAEKTISKLFSHVRKLMSK